MIIPCRNRFFYRDFSFCTLIKTCFFLIISYTPHLFSHLLFLILNMNLFSSFIIFRVNCGFDIVNFMPSYRFLLYKKSEQKYDYIETKEVDSHINYLFTKSTSFKLHFYYNISLFNFLIFQESLIKKYIHIPPVRPVITFAHIGTLDSIGLKTDYTLMVINLLI